MADGGEALLGEKEREPLSTAGAGPDGNGQKEAAEEVETPKPEHDAPEDAHEPTAEELREKAKRRERKRAKREKRERRRRTQAAAAEQEKGKVEGSDGPGPDSKDAARSGGDSDGSVADAVAVDDVAVGVSFAGAAMTAAEDEFKEAADDASGPSGRGLTLERVAPEEAVYIVCGAGRGAGSALAVLMARLGLYVLAVDADAEGLATTASAAASKQSLGRIVTVPADLSTIGGREALVAELAHNGHRVNALVLCDAVMGPLGSVQEVSLADWRQTMAINVEAPIFTAQAVLPFMTYKSRLLHVSSALAHRVLPHAALYCSTRAALSIAVESLKEEVAGDILVGSARPGPLDTPMQDLVASTSIEANPVAHTLISLKRSTTAMDLSAAHAVGRASGGSGLEDPAESAVFLAWTVLGASSYAFRSQELDPRSTATRDSWRLWATRAEAVIEQSDRERGVPEGPIGGASGAEAGAAVPSAPSRAESDESASRAAVAALATPAIEPKTPQDANPEYKTTG